MPRVKPLTEAERRARLIQSSLAASMKFERKTAKEVADAIGLTLATFNRRKRQPEKFTLEELWRLKKYLPGFEVTI